MKRFIICSLVVSAGVLLAADLPNSKDPPGMKRYEGSEIIGYRAPKFDEFLLPLGPAVQYDPPTYEKSLKAEGLISRYTYMAPIGRSPAELFRNYKQEFQRLGVSTMYEKAAGAKGDFGATLGPISGEDNLGQILQYDGDQERLLIGKTKDAKPTYYYVLVTAYGDGVIPEHLQSAITKSRALALVIVVAPEQMEQKMAFVNADDMQRTLTDSGKVVLYGILFDTDKDTLRPDSQPTLQEIAKLMKSQARLSLRIVGHTDNQGPSEHNLDLSRRRAVSVSKELTAKYGIAQSRFDSFGCGLYSPVATNQTEEGRAKNRRVELVKQ